MKQPDPRLFDDLARMAGGAMNIFSGLREQILQDARARVEEMATRMDLVPRADFDRLALQVEALQNKINALTKPAAKPTQKTAKKPAAAKKKKKSS